MCGFDHKIDVVWLKLVEFCSYGFVYLIRFSGDLFGILVCVNVNVNQILFAVFHISNGLNKKKCQR